MNRAQLLAQRRSLLVTECALQRITLIGQAHTLGYITDWVKTGGNLITHFKHLPGWAAALLAGIVIFVPGRAVSLAKNGLLLWQIWRTIFSKSVSKSESH